MNSEIRLKANLIVSAQITRCQGLFANAVILYRGDDERGLVLIKKYVPGHGVKIYMQGRNDDDEFCWLQPLGVDWISEEKADQYIFRQRNFDEDLWVIEIDDARDAYSPE